MNPQYTEDDLARYYSTYFPPTEQRPIKAMVQTQLQYLKVISNYINPSRLLDIGCGRGFLLSACEEMGWPAIGYDVDPETVSRVAEQTGLEMTSGNFFEVTSGLGRFDVVSLNQVLEHVKEPHCYLEHIHTLLNPGGIFFIAVPNVGSRSARLKYYSEKLGFRRKKRGAWLDAEKHIWYYTPETLSATLERYDYDVILMQGCFEVEESNGKPHKQKSKHGSAIFALARSKRGN